MKKELIHVTFRNANCITHLKKFSNFFKTESTYFVSLATLYQYQNSSPNCKYLFVKTYRLCVVRILFLINV